MNLLNLFPQYQWARLADRRDATQNYLNKTAGNPQGVDATTVQSFNHNQMADRQAAQSEHLQNMSTFLDILGSADQAAVQAVGPAPTPLPDNATPEQRDTWNQSQHAYEAQVSQATGQARQQAWEQASRIAPSLGIDPEHMAPMQQDFMQHGRQFAEHVHQAIQSRLSPNTNVGVPVGQDAEGNVVVSTRGGQQTVQGVRPTSSVDTETRVAATRDVAGAADVTQNRAIDQRAAAAALAHPAGATTGAEIAAPILEAAVPAALANIDRLGGLLQHSVLFQNDNRLTLAARVAEAHAPGSQWQANVNALQHQMALIDLRAMRASGFSLGRVTNTEFLAAASALANLDPSLDRAQLQAELARLTTHLQAFQTALTADMNDPVNAHLTPVAPAGAPAAADPAAAADQGTADQTRASAAALMDNWHPEN